jgi:hypothetical protein
METVRHPIFARVYERLSRLMERDIGKHRDELLAGLSGRVLEIGAGNGMNFPHYPSTVDEVVALEPEPHLREKARQAAADAPVRVAAIARATPLARSKQRASQSSGCDHWTLGRPGSTPTHMYSGWRGRSAPFRGGKTLRPLGAS